MWNASIEIFHWYFLQRVMFNESKGGGPVVKNSPYDAGDVSSIPGQGTKIPHLACEPQLEGSLCATNKTRHSQINKLKKIFLINNGKKTYKTTCVDSQVPEPRWVWAACHQGNAVFTAQNCGRFMNGNAADSIHNVWHNAF